MKAHASRRPATLGVLFALCLACGRNDIYPLVDGAISGSTGQAATGSTGAATGQSTGHPATGISGTSGHGGITGTSTGGSFGTDIGTDIGTNIGTNTGTSEGFGTITGTLGSTTGGTHTGTSSSSGCNPNAPPNELQQCGVGTDCGCPLVCVPSALGINLCEFTCSTLTDCPNLETFCSGGDCQPNLCGPGTDNGGLDATCTVAAGSDGSCIPSSLASINVGLCSQQGPEDAGCDSNATRSDENEACVAGDFCAAALGDLCAVLCDPFSAQSCGPNAICETLPGQDSRLGVCQPGGTTTGSTTGTIFTNTSTNGSTTGGTGGTGGTSSAGTGGTGSTSGTSGCNNPTSAEFQACTSDSQCSCDMTCVADPAIIGKVCEVRCMTNSGCSDLGTFCNNGACAIIQCGGATGNGSFNGTCNVLGTNDGTCEPLTPDEGTTSIGFCIEAGTATTSCDPSAGRDTDPSQICAPGSLCFGGTPTFGGTCNQLCNPFGGSCTDPNQFCSAIVNEPDLGICIDGNF